MTETMNQGESGSTGRDLAVTTVVVADLAREVVAEVAPAELEYLVLVTAARNSGKGYRSKSLRGTGGSVGSGAPDPTVVAAIVYPLLTGTIAQVLGASVFAKLQGRRWWRRKRDLPPRTRVTLDQAHLAEVRDACVRHGITLGLSEARATLLAEAVDGVLRRGIDEGDDDARR